MFCSLRRTYLNACIRPPSEWKSDGWGLELVEVLEQSAECDFADS